MVVDHLHQPPYVVPLGRGAQVALVGVGIEVFSQHMGCAGQHPGDFPGPIAPCPFVLGLQAIEALARRSEAVASNLEDATRNANEFSRQLRANPGVLLRGREAEPGAGQ